MKTLVVGASGATGRLLTEQLLLRGLEVHALVRRPESLSAMTDTGNLTLFQGSISELSDDELAELSAGCDAIASCLGHNLSFRGIYGPPRRLVTDAVRRLCQAVQANPRESPVRFVLMNTAGNSNRDLREPISLPQKGVISLLRLLLPPHVDNEQASDFLRTEIGPQNPCVEWVAVRPDNLIDETEVGPYEVHPSPVRSAIFDAGTTSRINVAHFMAALISEDDLWRQWQGQMPVIYNEGFGRKSDSKQT